MKEVNHSELHSAYTYTILYQLVRYNLDLHHTDAYGYYQASLNVNLVVVKDNQNHLCNFNYFYDGLDKQLDPTSEDKFLDNISVEIVDSILSTFINSITVTDISTYMLSNSFVFNNKVNVPLLISSSPISYDDIHYENQFNEFIQLVNARRIPHNSITPGNYYLSILNLKFVPKVYSHYKNTLEQQSNQFKLEYLLITGIDFNKPLVCKEIIQGILKELNISSPTLKVDYVE